MSGLCSTVMRSQTLSTTITTMTNSARILIMFALTGNTPWNVLRSSRSTTRDSRLYSNNQTRKVLSPSWRTFLGRRALNTSNKSKKCWLGSSLCQSHNCRMSKWDSTLWILNWFLKLTHNAKRCKMITKTATLTSSQWRASSLGRLWLRDSRIGHLHSRRESRETSKLVIVSCAWTRQWGITFRLVLEVSASEEPKKKCW